MPKEKILDKRNHNPKGGIPKGTSKRKFRHSGRSLKSRTIKEEMLHAGKDKHSLDRGNLVANKGEIRNQIK